MAVRAPAVHAACEARLSAALRAALRTVRERVLVDALPLLSLVQSEPLRLQSSHLSFQEYFAARTSPSRRQQALIKALTSSCRTSSSSTPPATTRNSYVAT